jgi:hypothetical protein
MSRSQYCGLVHDNAESGTRELGKGRLINESRRKRGESDGSARLPKVSGASVRFMMREQSIGKAFPDKPTLSCNEQFEILRGRDHVMSTDLLMHATCGPRSWSYSSDYWYFDRLELKIAALPNLPLDCTLPGAAAKRKRAPFRPAAKSHFTPRSSPFVHLIYADAQCPPSTLRSAPVMKLLPGASRNTVGALKSSGSPSLSKSAPAIQVFSTSGSAASRASVMAVRIYWDEIRISSAKDARGGTYTW